MAEYTPLSEIPTILEFSRAHEGVDMLETGNMHFGLTWDFELPPLLDTERMAVNTTHLNRIQKTAAFILNSVASFDGKTEQFEPTINGVSSNGTATMGVLKKVQKADKSKNRVMLHEGIPIEVMRNHYATDVIHRLNKSQIVDDVISLRDKRNVTNEEAWSLVLDDHLNRSIRKSAAMHLMKLGRSPDTSSRGSNLLLSPLYVFYDIAAIGLLSSYTIDEFFIQNEPEKALGFAGAMLAYRAFSVFAEEKVLKQEFGLSFLKYRRWSLLHGWQPDRYLATDFLTRVNTLISVRK